MSRKRIENTLDDKYIELLEDVLFHIVTEVYVPCCSDLKKWITDKLQEQIDIVREIEDYPAEQNEDRPDDIVQNEIDDAIEKKHDGMDDDSRTYEEESEASEQQANDKRAGDEGWAD